MPFGSQTGYVGARARRRVELPDNLTFNDQGEVPYTGGNVMGNPLTGEPAGGVIVAAGGTRGRGGRGGFRFGGGGRVGGHSAGGTPIRWLDRNTYVGNDGRTYTIEFEGPGGRSVRAQPGNLQGSRLPGGLSRGSEIRRSMVLAAGGGAPRPGGGVGAAEGGLAQLGRVAREDAAAQQAAADEQHGRLLAQERAMEETLKGINPALVGTADANAALLRGEAQQAEDIGNQVVSRFDEQAKGIRSQLDKDLKGVFGAADEASAAGDEALGFARRAEQAGMAAVSGYDAGAHENIANVVAGMEQRFSSQMKSIETGMNPDGTMMTPEEQQAARRELQFATSQAVSGVVAEMRDRQQQTLAGLRMALGNIRVGAGQVALGAAGSKLEAGRLKLGAAETRAQTGESLAAGRLQAEQVRMGFRQLGASLLEAGANFQHQARALALQLEVSGRTALADMIRSNPRSVVAMFGTLLTLQEVGSAPGGQKLPAIPGF